jgi:diacylglycerol O-acyltransferase / wax synthase
MNDVVLAMCSGAVRAYLAELGQLPDSSLVSMVPVGLKSRGADSMAGGGGNAVGSVMVRLGTDLADPADRLSSIHRSMRAGKEALGSMTPNQIIAMSALGMAPSIMIPMLRLNGIVRPPFNLIISNVPGPRSTQYLNGARLTGTYPVSVPMQGMALNITCNSYADDMCFGLTGCRRSVPHLQRLLTYLDQELDLLESATGVA